MTMMTMTMMAVVVKFIAYMYFSSRASTLQCLFLCVSVSLCLSVSLSLSLSLSLSRCVSLLVFSSYGVVGDIV